MDKFISMELQGKIINKGCSSGQASRSLSSFLDLIFTSFSQEFGDVTPKSLTIPLLSISIIMHHPISSYNIPIGSETAEIYHRKGKQWKWNFPSIDHPSDQLTPTSPDIPSDPKAFTDKQTWTGPHCHWLANWSQVPLPGSTGFVHKPDLILVNNSDTAHDKVMWFSTKVIAEYMKETYQPALCIRKTMDTKAYLVLVDQPWRCFILRISIANCDLQVHLYNHSGGTISPPFNIHTNVQQFLFIITALPFGCHLSIGFNPTIEIHPPFFKREHIDSACKVTSNPKVSEDYLKSVEEWDGLSHSTSLYPIELIPFPPIASPTPLTLIESPSSPPLVKPSLLREIPFFL
ncbi:hypothetical protein JVU11DRAFT_8896 [Chiua virens]|nr:hypothetical protein JVU11DRAFT_8896 [Chiua virens]